MTPRVLAGILLLPLLCPAQTQEPIDIGTKFSTTVEESLFGTTTATTGGFRGEIFYLEPMTLALPKFSKLKPVGAIYTDYLYIPRRSFTQGFPGVTDRFEWFAIDYAGKFFINNDGKFEFVLISDDGSKLYVDRHLVINNDGHHPALRKQGAIKLSRGLHQIRLSYFQGPRDEIALVLGIRTPDKPDWRVFNMKDFRPPAGSDAGR